MVEKLASGQTQPGLVARDSTCSLDTDVQKPFYDKEIIKLDVFRIETFWFLYEIGAANVLLHSTSRRT